MTGRAFPLPRLTERLMDSSLSSSHPSIPHARSPHLPPFTVLSPASSHRSEVMRMTPHRRGLYANEISDPPLRSSLICKSMRYGQKRPTAEPDQSWWAGKGCLMRSEDAAREIFLFFSSLGKEFTSKSSNKPQRSLNEFHAWPLVAYSSYKAKVTKVM